MSRKIDPTSLTGIFQMISPVSERVKFHYETPPDDVVNFLIRAAVAPPAHGALSAKALTSWVSQVPTTENHVDPQKQTALNSAQFRFSSTVACAGKDPSTFSTADADNPMALFAMSKQGSDNKPTFVPLNMLTALDAPGSTVYDKCPVSYVMSTLPFLNPAAGRSADAEIFLNFMPSYVLSRMVPYVDVEFQFTRPFSESSTSSPSHLNSTGLLHFLEGGLSFSSPSSGPNDVLASSHRIMRDKDTETVQNQMGDYKELKLERSYAGMEIFTSPQTLVNPDHLDPSLRYKEILDPFRPFMTLISLQLEVAPTVGYGTYKTGNMVVKLHDRSRLSEVGDLLQPEIYTRTTLWITSGWMHPDESDNAYAAFINNNMLTRELYGIKNASYSFENDGEVTITLQLYTLGVTEMMDLKISAGPDKQDGSPSVESVSRELNSMFKRVGYLANSLGLLGSESTGTKDIRGYQVINDAASGTFPNYKDDKVKESIAALAKGLKTAKVDQNDVKTLIDTLSTLYSVDNDGKYNLEKKRSQAVESIVNGRFKQLEDNSKDPWIPWVISDLAGSDKKSPYVSNTFDQKELQKLVNNKTVKGASKSKNALPSSGICSFAKLVSTFLVPQVAEAGIADEFQVFFYAFNESAGAAAGQCIANFPIDLAMFRDQFNQHVSQTMSSRMSILEFLRFVIDAQLQDPRSLGYGTKAYYKPFKKGEVASTDDKVSDDFADFMTKNMSKYGPFHVPTIDTYLETVPLVDSSSEIVDLMSDVALGSSAKDSFYNSDGKLQRRLKGRYALRLHIYDKQLNPYKAVEAAMHAPSGVPGHFILVSQNEDAVAFTKSKLGSGAAYGAVEQLLMSYLTKADLSDQDKKLLPTLTQGAFIPIDLSSNQKVKDYVSSIVPTITVGCNGSTVTTAQLSTNQDALLSSVQMMKQSGRVNPQTPAGSGPGSLPITIIPGQLTLTTLGCPLAQLTQKYFVDFNTGTTADNVYCVNKLSHSWSPGKFETSWTFVWADAYGRIAGASDLKDYAKTISTALQPPPQGGGAKSSSSGPQNKK